MKQYKLFRDEWKDYSIVKVYSNKILMHRGIIKDNANGGVIEDACLALVQPSAYICREGETMNSSMYATMYLNEDNMGVGLLSHECLHVALAHERQVERFRMYYGEECGKHEERLAYFLGDLVASLVTILRKKGHIR